MIVKGNDGDAQNIFANPVIFFTLWVLIDRTFKTVYTIFMEGGG